MDLCVFLLFELEILSLCCRIHVIGTEKLTIREELFNFSNKWKESKANDEQKKKITPNQNLNNFYRGLHHRQHLERQ